MNPVVDYFLFCENVIVGERGRFTFANVYDEVYVLSLPTVVKALFVAIKVGLPGAKPNKNTHLGYFFSSAYRSRILI
jgi:hypothetical protein